MPQPQAVPAKALEALARKMKVSPAGTRRQVLRRIGRQVSSEFDERSYLGTGPAPPSGSFLNDTFSEAGGYGSLETKHTGEKGATWVASLGMTVGAPGRVWGNATGYRYAYASGLPAGADYSVEAGLYCASVVGSVRSAGPAARVSTSADTSYQLYWVTNTGFSLVKRVAGSETVLGTYALVGTVGQEVKATVSAVGTAIKGFIDGVERISATDSAITAASRAGFRCHSTEGAAALVNYITATDAPVDLEATLNGSASASVNLSGVASMASSPTGSATAEGALGAVASMESQPSGQGSMSGELGAITSIEASLSGVGAVEGELGAVASMEAQPQGEGSVSGELGIVVSLEAAPGGVGSISAELRAVSSMEAAPSGSGEVNAELEVVFQVHAASVKLTARPKTSVSLTARPKTNVALRVRPQK